MKANAKKLLALIMAMVMCLSLAAPAMAAGADAVAETSLSTQAVGLATSIALKSNAADGFTVVISGEGTRSYTWESNGDEYVTVTKVGSEKGLVSQEAKMVYTAKLVASKASPTDLVDSVSYTKTTAQLKLNDTSLTWEAVPAEATVKNDAGKAYGRQGSFYQEEVEAGKWSYFWKLIPVKDNDFVTATKAADQKYVYAKSTGKAKLSTASEIKAALFASDMATYTDLTPTDAYATQSIDEKNGATTVADVATATTYTFTVADPSKVIGTSSNWTDSGSKLNVFVQKDGTFSVMATYTDLKAGSTTEYETKTVADATVMKSILDVTGTVESVTVNSANASYFDVKVSTKGSTVATDHTGTVGSKTSYYNVPGKSETLVGLTDTAEGGIYTDKSGAQKAINAGEKVYGPLVVTNDVSGLGSVKKGATYTDLEALKEAAVNESCKDSKKVEYKQLIMNAKVNGTANTGVVETGSNTYTFATGWDTKTDAQFEAGSLTVDPSAYHFYRKKTVKVPATCEADGSEIVVEACDVCGAEKAGTKKVTVLPKDTSEPVKTNKELGWVLKEQFTAAEYAKLPATVQSYYTKSGSNYVRVPAASLPGHYLAKVEVTNIKSGSKGQAGTYTATVYCNHGVAHITEERELEKDELEYSGNWDNITWSAQNSQYARDPSRLFGYRAVVADTDVDYPELALTDSSFEQFVFDGTSSGTAADIQDDGTYFDWYRVQTYDADDDTYYYGVPVTSKDAAGKKTVKRHYYSATLTVQDITSGAKDCQDGSANIVITVYEDLAATTTSATTVSSSKAVAKAVKDGKLVEKKTFTKPVVIPAQKSHVDANNDGKCDNCGAEINQTTPDNENTVDISKAVVTFDAMTYTGKAAQPTVTVTLDGVKLAKGVDYEVEEMQDVNAGTYPLIVKGKGDFSGRVVGNVTIKKAANTLKVSATTVKVKVKDVKKKAKTYALKVTKAKGKVTVKSNNKNVSWKSNKITVKKGAKKATVKLTVKAKGNANYKAGTKTVKVVIK